MLDYTVNQPPHWDCQHYGHSGGTGGWLGVERCQLYLQDTSRRAKWVTGFHCVLSVVEWLIVYQVDNYLYPDKYSQTIC